MITLAQLIYNTKGIVYTCGNGGSASTASHFTQDLIKACGIRSICMTDNIGFILATSNDEDFSKVFKNYLDVMAREDDLLVLFSGSGNSRNLVTAVNSVKGFIPTVAIVGFDGGILSRICDHVFHVPVNDMRIVETEHLGIAHNTIAELEIR